MMRTDEMGLSERVRNLVDHLGYELDPSILIGGWATQLRVDEAERQVRGLENPVN